MLASSWASLAHLEAMLGDVGAKMADKIGKMAIKSAKMSQDGETCWQRSAPTRGLGVGPAAEAEALKLRNLEISN